MEEAGDPHFKRDRPAAYSQPPPLHMPPTDAQNLHSYHHPAPQGAHMQQPWNPAPSPYGDGNDQRPPTDGSSHHPPPPTASYPQQGYPPPPPASQTPTYPPESVYSRQNSVSGPTRSPPSAHPQHYPPHMNGAPPPPPEGYYPRQDYNNRQPYPPSESPAIASQQPPLHVQTTNHEMMPAQPPPAQGPPPGYPPPPHSAVPPPTPYHWPPPSEWYQQQRRKPVRAAQACDSCRQRKAKCDEGRPECTHCKENGMRCTYRDVPPQKQEKQMLQINEKVDDLSQETKTLSEKLNEHIKSTDQKLDDILRRDERLTSILNSLLEIRGADSRSTGSAPMVKTRSRPQTKEEPRSVMPAGVVGHHVLNGPFLNNNPASAEVAYAAEPSDSGVKQRGPMGASDLLMWPSIRELVPKDIPVTYVMDGEVERGLLRLYGCGEGEDKGDGHNGVPSPVASNCSGRMEEDVSTSSPSGAWGTGQLPQREGSQHPVHDHPGGVTPDGELLLDRKVVDTYVKSYLDRMHILHPFLDLKVLRKMVHVFKAKHSWDYNGINRLAPSISAGTKRKREVSESPSSVADEPLLHSIPQHNGARAQLRHNQIEHSVSNAIILLVIALGKICMHDKALPGPPRSSTVPLSAKTPQQQPMLGYGDLPPIPPSSAPASPYTLHANGTSIGSATSNLQGKNMDVIPGLAYFAKAADILGELPGGVDVSHIQANLLAGLYMGQLARVIPSHWYISNACRACQILIRSVDYKENKMSPERRNLINFAFWSCLQLESDILAELDIPPSGIVEKEGSMMFEIPNALTIADPEKEEKDSAQANPHEFLRHYSNQIQLRRTINDAVHNIYNNEREWSKPSKLLETLGENLESWRSLLRDWDWNDADHQSFDINHARMRAKYYGAKYIISRPALQYALSMSNPGTPISRPSDSPAGTAVHSELTSPAMVHHGEPTSSRRVSEMRPPQRGTGQLEDYILDACKRCVDAAQRSTTAFDKVPGRLVITNILGTAHAQFGNVLVLAATYNSRNPQLSQLVNQETLRFLLMRTIQFLDDKSGISPALAKDAQILRHVQNKLFPSSAGAGLHVSSATSFSSNH